MLSVSDQGLMISGNTAVIPTNIELEALKTQAKPFCFYEESVKASENAVASAQAVIHSAFTFISTALYTVLIASQPIDRKISGKSVMQTK